MNFDPFIVAIEISCIYSFYHAEKCLRSILKNNLSIGFLCENRTLRFGKPDGPVFLDNSYIHSIDINLHLYYVYLIPFVS
jgi:hypothetical protein